MRKASAGFLPFWAELDINSVREAESEILKKVGIKGAGGFTYLLFLFLKLRENTHMLSNLLPDHGYLTKIRVCAKVLPLGNCGNNLLPKLSNNRSG